MSRSSITNALRNRTDNLSSTYISVNIIYSTTTPKSQIVDRRRSSPPFTCSCRTRPITPSSLPVLTQTQHCIMHHPSNPPPRYPHTTIHLNTNPSVTFIQYNITTSTTNLQLQLQFQSFLSYSTLSRQPISEASMHLLPVHPSIQSYISDNSLCRHWLAAG